MDKLYLVNLCSRSWALTALQLIERGTSARVSPLAAAAGCGRTAMSASVSHLLEMGLLERNPGAGHPMRPPLFEASGRCHCWTACHTKPDIRSCEECLRQFLIGLYQIAWFNWPQEAGYRDWYPQIPRHPPLATGP